MKVLSKNFALAITQRTKKALIKDTSIANQLNLSFMDDLKGRDWYDFNWYVAQDIKPNLLLLQNALNQYGPWQNQNVTINNDWLVKALREKIESIEWKKAIIDVEQFIKVIEHKSLSLWSNRFFMSKLKKLSNLLKV